MKFDEDSVRKVADLARMQLSEEEVAAFAGQVGKVLGYVEKLNGLNTSDVEPMTHALELDTPFRASDEPRPSSGAEVLLESAPEQFHESYKVPQVIGGGN